MNEIQELKEAILKYYPRLSQESSFRFSCHADVSCWNGCCGDVTIFLTPYDIIRLKRALDIPSQEFLSEYTVSHADENLKYPAVLLRMNDDDKKSCPFVDKDGCKVYEDRPWPCRMYPLGMASPNEGDGSLREEFYFILQDMDCRGFAEKKEQTVAEWFEDQGIDEYKRMGDQFKALTLHPFFREGRDLTPAKAQMFYLACYNLDGLRDLMFNTTFFEKFEVDDETRTRIAEDDVELLKFGYSWLRFALFGENTLRIRRVVLEAKRREAEK